MVRPVALSAILLSLAGCAAEPALRWADPAAPPPRLAGFEVPPPPGRWYRVGGSHREVAYVRYGRRPGGVYGAQAVLLPLPFLHGGPDQFAAALARHRAGPPPARFRLLRERAEPASWRNLACVRFSLAARDEGAPRPAGSAAPVLEMTGLTCALGPGRALELRYSRRGPEEQGGMLEEQAAPFLAGVRPVPEDPGTGAGPGGQHEQGPAGAGSGEAGP